MTQQPFSRPGAIDLSGLKRTSAPAPAATPGGGAPASSAYSIAVTPENVQDVLESSMTAPVVLVFFSSGQVPESVAFAEDVARVADEYDGRFLAAKVDVDANPQLASALQVQQVPLMLVLVEGQPATQPIPGAAPIDDIRAMFNQLAQQLTASGLTGR
ncbi:MAG TPA: thioredoxin domain-containing protein, partial [Nocardioides sp.]|nr:thioredoxin domain-containing protein [Nocardioides sp.]